MKFGTDGIRGIYGENLTPVGLFLLGNALAEPGAKIAIARDTRTSGVIMQRQVTDGVLAAGGSVLSFGVLPTAAVSTLVRAYGCRYGIMLTASHNAARYNGVKVFDRTGEKLDRMTEQYIEQYIVNAVEAEKCTGGVRLVGDASPYTDRLRAVAGSLAGLTVALDCANGAGGAIAYSVFSGAGARAYSFCDNPTGEDINEGCGATHADNILRLTAKTNSDLGFAFDGDADRLVAVKSGRVLDGDDILFLLARALRMRRQLNGNAVVVTVMTNLATEKALRKLGIDVVRTAVGDANVASAMKAGGYSLGGESAGHIMLPDCRTGDGILTALYLCRLYLDIGESLFEGLPQKYPTSSINLSCDNAREVERHVMSDEDYARLVACEDMRIVLRASGTEPVLRIYAEAETQACADEAIRALRVIAEKYMV